MVMTSVHSSSDGNAYVAVTGTNIPIITINTYKDPAQPSVKLPKVMLLYS